MTATDTNLKLAEQVKKFADDAEFNCVHWHAGTIRDRLFTCNFNQVAKLIELVRQDERGRCLNLRIGVIEDSREEFQLGIIAGVHAFHEAIKKRNKERR